jgi:hypothetical protein
VGVVVFYFYLSLVMKIYVGDEDEFGEDLNNEKFWWLWWRNSVVMVVEQLWL